MIKKVDSATTRTDRPGRNTPSLTSIGFLLHLAQSRLRDAVIAAIEHSGLHPGQLAVVGALMDRGGMSQTRLSALIHIEKSSLVLFLDALEAGGWVRREQDPEDRRAHIVQLTPEGAAKFSDLGPRLLSAQQHFLNPLSETEVKALTDMLKRLAGSPEPDSTDQTQV